MDVCSVLHGMVLYSFTYHVLLRLRTIEFLSGVFFFWLYNAYLRVLSVTARPNGKLFFFLFFPFMAPSNSALVMGVFYSILHSTLLLLLLIVQTYLFLFS